MIITVISVSEEFTKNGDAYKKVTCATEDGRETTKSIFNQLEGKWPLLVEGKALEFKMEKKGQFWNVVDITPVGDSLPPPKSDKAVLPEHQKEIDRAQESPPPAPQAVGMITKEIGDMVRTKYLKPLFGDEAYIELIKWYRGQVLAITRVPFDGAKLPTFGKPKTQEPEPFTEPEDIPF